MNPAARIIRQLLLDLDIAAPSGDWRVFAAVLPDQPFNAIGTFDTAGLQDGRLMWDGQQVIHDGFQVQVRGTSYPTTWAKVREIALALDGQRNVTVSIGSGESYVLSNVSRKGAILPMGIVEEGDRRMFLFSINGCISVRDEA